LGAFGINQNTLNLNSLFDANLNTTSVEQNVTNTDDQQALPSEQQTVSDEKSAADASKAVEVTPQQESSEDANDTKLEENAEVSTQAANAEASTVVADTKTNVSNTKKTITSNDVSADAKTTESTISKNANLSKEQATPITADKKAAEINSYAAPTASLKQVATQKVASNVTTNNNNVNTQNRQVLVYKNVDLSQCDSVNDVVNKLQNNGYTNITKGNIQNIKSLEDILALINGDGSSNNNGNTPTTKPVPTTKPAPTTKPTPTTQPKPTTKPTPTAQPTPTTKPSNNTGISGYASEVLRLVNQERAKAGLSAFTTNSTLTAAANKRAQETVQSFSHTRPNGTSFSTVLQEYGVSYRAAGENIAYGQRSPQEVVTGWMNSPGHRANILNSSFNKIGIGVYQSSGTIYWSQLFTN
jgi:uncharacterized protein YkwD